MVSDYKGFELKGPYHVPRCLMQLVTLLEEYLEQKGKANDSGFDGRYACGMW